MRTSRPSRRSVPLWPAVVAWTFCWGGMPLFGQASEARMTPLVKAVRNARPSVVNIHSEKTLANPDQRVGTIETGRRVNGMGTGVVLDERGYIVTNQHVIDGVEKIRVTLHDGTVHPAVLVAYDRETDLAIIKIEHTDPLPIITIGTSSDLMQGETVAAMGNAFGYEHTVTRGIISAMHRNVQLSENQQYSDLIQTDAGINPGNSGGPLLNIDGEMIGINVAVRAGAQGIGFAIPVDKALEIAAKLLSTERLAQVRHGIRPADSGERGPLKGLVIAAPGGETPAAKAGLAEGDVIETVDGKPVVRHLDLERHLLRKKAGDKVTITARREGEALEVQLTLDSLDPTIVQADLASQTWSLLGMRLSPLGNRDLSHPKGKYRGGLLIEEVQDDGPAFRQGIRAGDILVGLHIWETISLENVAHIVNRPDLAKVLPLKFYVLRSGKTLFGYLPLEIAKAP